MIKDKITILGGEVIRFDNIEELNADWQLLNNDPQIYIKFNNPITDLRIKISLDIILNKSINMVVYYKNEGEDFTEKNSMNFNVNLFQETLQELHFNRKVNEIRLDIANENLMLRVNHIIVEDISNHEYYSCLKENFIEYSKQEKIIILSHDFSNSGAPILAYNIAKKMKENGLQVIVLVGSSYNNRLEEKYRSNEIPFIYLDNGEYNYANMHYRFDLLKENSQIEELSENIIRIASGMGYHRIITNTIVAGKYVDLLRKYDFQIVSLIHEMKTSIDIYNYVDFGKMIALYSDIIIFPDEVVKNDFESIYTNINGTTVIRPQGVYLNTSLEKQSLDIFKLLNISENTPYVLGSGVASLRKGIDLFIGAANILYQINPDLHFIWAGEFNDQKELGCWMKTQMVCPNLHIIPFVKEPNLYLGLLKNANVFWLTSREDPFPSVALEAMSLNIPVVGFKNTGGFNTMAMDNRAILIENFNVYDLAVVTNDIIQQKGFKINTVSIKKFIDELNFEEYIDFLINIFVSNTYDWLAKKENLTKLSVVDSLIYEQPIFESNLNGKKKRRSIFKFKL